MPDLRVHRVSDPAMTALRMLAAWIERSGRGAGTAAGGGGRRTGWLRRDLRFVPVEGTYRWTSWSWTRRTTGPRSRPGNVRGVRSGERGRGGRAHGVRSRRSCRRAGTEGNLIEALVEVATGDVRSCRAPPVGRERIALGVWLRSMTKASVAGGWASRRIPWICTSSGSAPSTPRWATRCRLRRLLARALEDGLVGPEDVLTGPVTG